MAESKDLDSDGPELKLSFAKHVSLGKALSVHLFPSDFYNGRYELMYAEDMASRAQKTVVNINIRLILTDLNHQLELIARKVWRFA